MLTINVTGSPTLSLAFTSFDFPGGEVGFKLGDDYRFQNKDRGDALTINARIQSSRDVMELVMATDALRRKYDWAINLVLPYVPYSRQDRVCVPGEAFSLKAFAGIINGLNFKSVTVFDPHSEVTPAVFDRVKVIDQLKILQNYAAFSNSVLINMVTFVSPDAGANKKTAELASYFSHNEFIRADKLRDLGTGAIKETIVYAEDLSDRTVVIVDDICDGGRTFVELAKVLKAKKVAKVVLYVTHGIFSKGIEVLFEGGIDEIYTTNSFRPFATVPPNFTVLNLESIFSL